MTVLKRNWYGCWMEVDALKNMDAPSFAARRDRIDLAKIPLDHGVKINVEGEASLSQGAGTSCCTL